MSTQPQVAFGYNPPTGNRLIERVERPTFVADLGHVLDVASQIFSSLWVSDHFMTEDRFRMECWTQLAWMAARYPGPELGTIVMSNSYRHPPLLAKMAASVQEFSHGRLILGYGAGWDRPEYEAYGYPFPPLETRIAQMVEGIEVMRALWTGGPVTYDGRFYQLRDAWCMPVPVRPIPIMIGGDGEKYLLKVVAEHADWWNALHRSTEALRRKMGALLEHCATIGRDPAGIRKTYTFTAYLAKSRADARRAAGAAAERELPPFIGEPGELAAYLHELVEVGFDTFQLVFPGFPETRDMELFAERVLPEFRA